MKNTSRIDAISILPSVFVLVTIAGFMLGAHGPSVQAYTVTGGWFGVLISGLACTLLNKVNKTPKWLRTLNLLWLLGAVGLFVWFVVGVMNAKY